MNLKYTIMKTTKTFTFKKSNIILLGLFFTLFFTSNSFLAQEITVKGVVSGEADSKTEVLTGTNIYLKGSKIVTTSNKKGEFTFPQKLKTGDVLVFSYLGFVKRRIKINADSSFINVVLKEDENQMLGALNSNKRYTSKRSKQE